MDLELAELLDRPDPLFLHVARHDAGECAAQVRGQQMRFLVLVQRQVAHVLVRGTERLLEFRVDLQAPVEVVRVAARLAELAHLADPLLHLARHRIRVVDDDLVAPLRRLAQGQADELVDLFEVFARRRRPCKHERERLFRVVRVEQDAEDVQDLFRRAGAAREHDDAVARAHEGFQALLDVRHDHEVVDDRVRRLGRDDARLRDAEIAAALQALLGVADGGALHRALHRTRAAARADIEFAQAELVAHVLRVVVLDAVDRVPAPAHDEVRIALRLDHVGVAQDVEDGVRDALGAREVEARIVRHLEVHVDDVAQDREQVLVDTLDHLAVHEGVGRRAADVELDAAFTLDDLDVEVLVAFEQLLAVVDRTAGVEHRQRAFAEDLV